MDIKYLPQIGKKLINILELQALPSYNDTINHLFILNIFIFNFNKYSIVRLVVHSFFPTKLFIYIEEVDTM